MMRTMSENNAARNQAFIPGKSKPGVTKLSAIPLNIYRRPLYTRRSQARIYRKSRIRFAEYNSSHFHDALMLNESSGGMYFETDIQLPPGTLIHINIIPPPYMRTWSPDNMYTAEVRWCRPINPDRFRRFGVGVLFSRTVTQ